jgi:hypothetical protein
MDLVEIDDVERAAKRGVVEVPARRDVEVLAEVVAEWPLAAISARREPHPRVDAPKAERNVLAEMPEADLQIREFVE